MSDLVNESEVTEEVSQPADGVAPEAEDNSTEPQVDQAETEFVIEDEGDQETQPANNFDDEAKRKAAFAREKRKRREEREKRERVERELEELKRWKAQQERGPKPTLESCDYDEKAFEQKLTEWHQASGESKPQPAQSQAQPNQDHEPNYEAQFYLEEDAKKLKQGGITDYDEKLDNFKSTVQSYGVDPDQVLEGWATIAREDGTFSAANAAYMIGRNPDVLKEIGQQKTALGVAKILKREASKLKPRQRKTVETQPEPNISSRGPIDNAHKATQKAYDKWMESGTLADYRAYKAIKAKSKQS